MNVVVAGGGTAGHVFPGIALANVLRERGHAVRFLGTERGQEVRLVAEAGFPLDVLPLKPFIRSFSPAVLAAPLAAWRAVRRCRPIVREADVVVGMGGYASVPAVLAARREHRPIVIHEQNAVAGLANRMGGRLSWAVALSFADARRWFPRRRRVEVTGNPVRASVLEVRENRETLAKEAREEFELEESRTTVLVFGGSQGALHLNRAVIGAARLLGRREDLQLLLITGAAHHEMVSRELPVGGGLVVRAVPFVGRMDQAYAAADPVVSRAGATTIAEVSVSAIPAILVPYPYATGRHQEANARALQRAGGASVLLDDQLTSETLAERVEDLVGFPERLRAMATASAAFGRPDATGALADLVQEAAS